MSGEASAGPLQCWCWPHWHLHPAGHCHAADEGTGYTQCLPLSQENESSAHEDGPDTGIVTTHTQ